MKSCLFIFAKCLQKVQSGIPAVFKFEIYKCMNVIFSENLPQFLFRICFGSESIETSTGTIIARFEPIVKVSGRLWHFHRPYGVPKLSVSVQNRSKRSREGLSRVLNRLWRSQVASDTLIDRTEFQNFRFGSESIETSTGTIIARFELIVKVSGRLWHFHRPHGTPKLSASVQNRSKRSRELSDFRFRDSIRHRMGIWTWWNTWFSVKST